MTVFESILSLKGRRNKSNENVSEIKSHVGVLDFHQGAVLAKMPLSHIRCISSLLVLEKINI